MSRRSLRVGVAGLWMAACLDPLFEAGDPLAGRWVVCCPAGAPATCLCEDAASCGSAVYACGENQCSTSSCTSGAGGGVASMDAGSAFSDGGAVAGGAGGGGGGGAGGGGGKDYRFCCAAGRVETCECATSGCAPVAFTPCAGGGCVEGAAVCP